MRKNYLLFDLDGTLTNSKEGITKCVQYALDSFGIKEPDLDKLECYIGPALDESFQVYHGLTQEQAHQAVLKYRERFTDVGIFENEVYPGMEECLKKVKEAGGHIALATCKPEEFAIRILDHFHLTQYFEVIVGSGMDGSRKHKDEVITEVFKRWLQKDDCACNVNLVQLKADAFMIGDRNQDILGAKATRLESVGVRFGFAEEGELEEAGADYIVKTPEELTSLLLSECGNV